MINAIDLSLTADDAHPSTPGLRVRATGLPPGTTGSLTAKMRDPARRSVGVRYKLLCGLWGCRHKPHYVERRIMPSGGPQELVRVGEGASPYSVAGRRPNVA